MPWKMNGEHIVMENGNPVWVYSDGKEAAADFESALTKINTLNSESASRRREITDLQAKLKPFEGIEKPEEFVTEARKAMDTVKNYKDKQLIDAGEAERVKSEAVKAMQLKVDEAEKRASDASQSLHREMIGGRFARSKFIGEKLVIPADIAQAVFGTQFKIDGDKVVGLDASGNPLYSRVKPGEPADFDEALGMMVDAYPNKNQILKAPGGPGGGSKAGDKGGGGGGTVVAGDDAAFLANLDKIASGEIKVEPGSQQ